MRIKILVAFLLITGLSAFAQSKTDIADLSGIDSKIKNFMQYWNIPGASVAITKNGKSIYNKGFGFANQAHTRAAEADDLYRIASVSKPVTSIAIMKLIEEGKLSLNDEVFGPDKILDQPYYLKVITDVRIYSITVKDLLEHTSGWDRSFPCDGYPHSDPAFYPLHVSSVLNEPNPVGDSTLIKFSLLKGVNHAPGTTYAYSNIGYLVLGKIIEKVSGMKYEKYVQENIMKPLAIKDMQLGKNLLSERRPNEVEYISSATTASAYGDGNIVPWQYGGFNLEAMNAHGGWIASADDLTKILLAVDGFDTSPDILRPETIQLMSEPGNINPAYAKGWFVNSGNNWWHTGCLDGTATFICRTNDGYTWAFLFNSRSDNGKAFWNALDRLPWDCIKTISDVVMNDGNEKPAIYPLEIAP